MLKQSFLQQLKDVDFNLPDLEQAAKKKAGMVGTWIQESPLDFLGELRDRSPIFPTPLFTIVTRYTDVIEIFRSDEVFTIDTFKKKIQRNIGSFILGINNSPEHERQKSILRLAFPREDAAYLRAIVLEETQKLLKQIAASKTFDLVSQYARLLPTLTIRRYLGLELIPIEKIIQWTRPIFRDIFANVINDSEIEQEASKARADAVAYIDELIICRHKQIDMFPEITPITVIDRLLVMQRLASTQLSDKEIRNCLLGLLVGTVDLTSIAIISALIELLNRPTIFLEAQTAAKQDNDQAIANYTWEALRFRPPVVGLFRTCTQDYILGHGTPHQTQIKAGTIVYAASAAAMHDETQIDNKSEFRVGRPQNNYLFFESGLHTCLGKYFSLVQIPLAIKGLLNLGNFEIVSEFQKDRGFPESYPMKIV